MSEFQPVSSFPCTHCKGAKGKLEHRFTKFAVAGLDNEGKQVPAGEYGYQAELTWKDCYRCDGKGEFPGLTQDDLLELASQCLVSKGRTKGRLKTSRPKYARTVAAARAYYVWRLARFHGGQDMTMPMGADAELGGDGAKPILDELSRIVARVGTGRTQSVGEARWTHALTGQGPDYLDMLIGTGHATHVKVG